METRMKRIGKESRHLYYTVIREVKGDAGIMYDAYVLTDKEYEQEPVQLDLHEKGLIIKKAIPDNWDYKTYLIGTFSHETMDQLEATIDAFAARAVK